MAVKKAGKAVCSRRPLDWGTMLDEQGRDPSVEAAFGCSPVVDDPVFGRLAQETQRKRSMTKAQRKQAAVDAQRNKVTYDLPTWLTEAMQQTAEAGEYPCSHLAALLFAYGLKAMREGILDVASYKELARSPRFRYWLKFDEDDFGGVK